MQLFEKILTVEQADGKVVDVRLPSIMQAEEFKHRYDELLEMGQEAGISDRSFEDSYANIKKFRRKVNQVLMVVGLDGTKLSGNMICTLLFPHTSTEGEEEVFNTRGALVQFIFGARVEEGTDKIPKEELDVVAEIWGELWAMTEDWNEVINVLNTVSFNDLGKIMEHRNKALMSPEEKAKQKQHEGSRKLMENLKAGKLKGAKPEPKTEELSEEEMLKFFK